MSGGVVSSQREDSSSGLNAGGRVSETMTYGGACNLCNGESLVGEGGGHERTSSGRASLIEATFGEDDEDAESNRRRMEQNRCESDTLQGRGLNEDVEEYDVVYEQCMLRFQLVNGVCEAFVANKPQMKIVWKK